jgi:phosphoglycerol transferase MdoB-like AlkP superfamily enzyme
MNHTEKKQGFRKAAAGKFGQPFVLSMLILLGIGTGLASLLLAAAMYGLPMFYSYFQVPLLLLLNLLPPVLLALFFYFVSGRPWIGFLAGALPVLALSIVNFYKLQLRNDPFIATDVGFIHEAKNIVSGYALTFNARVALAVLFLIVGTVFAAVFLRRNLKGWKVRVIGAAAVLLLSSLLYACVCTSDKVYSKAANNENINIWSDQQVYISKGFVYPFLHSIKDAFPTPPEGYDAAEAAAALADYATGNIDDDQKVDIISVMLESYADLSQYDTIDFNVDVYGPLHALEEESYSGTLIDNVFAGDTIKTERAFLTGFTEIDNYRTATNSYVYYLREQGYYAEGLHAGDGWFYNRQNVNRYLGFDNYYFLEDFEDGNRTDEFLFSQILQCTRTGTPIRLTLITACRIRTTAPTTASPRWTLPTSTRGTCRTRLTIS